MKYCILILIVFKSLSVCAQTESIHLHLDKSIVYPEDTVWFSGYVFEGNHISKRSTNLYVELYDSEGKLQSRGLFPIANGLCYGQVPVPGGAGLYWIRSYTRNSGFFLSSLTVRGKDQKLIIRTLIRNIEKPVKSVPVNMSLDKGKCTINIEDTQPCTYSLAIVNANAVGQSPNILNALSPAGMQQPVDENGLSYTGRLNLGKSEDPSVKIPDMTVMLQDKNVKGPATIVKLDETHRFLISGMAFQDTATLYYGLNEKSMGGGTKIKDFNIQLDPPVYPEFKIPDPATYRLDTVSIAVADNSSPRLLKRVKIKTKKIRPQGIKEFDKLYTSGRFSWPGRYSYNLMDTSHYDPNVITNILLYLSHEMPMFKYDVMESSTLPTYKNKYVTFYLDEQLINYKDLVLTPMTDLAYVKVIEEVTDDDKNTRNKSDIPDNTYHRISDTLTANFGTDNGPGAMICIYRRKGKDLQYISSDNMKTLKLIGYNRSVKWTRPDLSTLLWMPNITNKNYTFNLPKNAESGPYKLIFEGEDAAGNVFHFEQLIKPEAINK